MMRWLGYTPLCCLLCACDVASIREAPNTIAHNECQSNADCGVGTCSSDKQCRSTTAAFQTVLLEVTPPADGSTIAGVQFLQDVDLSGGDASVDLGLISQVAGQVKAKGRTCPPQFIGPLGTLATAADSSVPARVSLIPSSGTLGLYSPRAVVQSGLRGDSYFGFSVNVSPGTYDIYIEPNRQLDESCPVPPQLTRDRKIDPGNLSLDIFLPEPSVFEFHVTWPLADGALNGWWVDMLDPASGRAISNRVPLALGTGGKTDYVASLTYNPVVMMGSAKAQVEDQLVRLSPPDGVPEDVALPTVLLARSALGLFAAGRGTLTEFDSLPPTVHVHGQVTAGNTPLPAAATVTLVAKKITGIDPGVLASLVRTVSVGADGQFDVYLLPGTYRVSTVPQSPLDPGRGHEMPLAADTREWIVPSTPVEQAGKVIELGLALPVIGRVLDASNDPVVTAQVQAVASPLSIQSDAFQEALGGPGVRTARLGRRSEQHGRFRAQGGPGQFRHHRASQCRYWLRLARHAQSSGPL